ncbi:16S rRNA (cytidine1402-2'-O)-methyltransferase [Lampropedia hyalina DSM 16112]|jgi:16S rRNA (cytidine1402-2'-O)-methyltransferase|uniref:16S rRNA (Cytidine1402-2'-O)-methyltransferase n=1 Tax=Lampropedia hyalina DSM 16112 TaxID=1122156 RepID=A0A1M5F5E7_9BURK|nr:SAM-dependent methyltransferase [Lampropedia hyalina]SHF86675.1 16S rRNA (cytidine1402-2'-O)-methyltransferase [Lampropedia hyalina DSM 16112]
MPTGTLYLVPAPLDFGCESAASLDTALPRHTLQQAARLTHWIAENAKTTRAYLKRVDALYPLAAPLQAQQIVELPRQAHKKGDHHGSGQPFDARPLLEPALQGHDIGLVSEAGLPGVADPGSSVVRAAHTLQLRVVPLAGSTSLLLALAASGLNGQHFAFVGYLPQDAAQRTQQIRKLENLARQSGQSQICMETPFRNAALWQALLNTLQADTWLSVSAGLTLETATSHSRPVREWRTHPVPVDNQTPAIFCFGR